MRYFKQEIKEVVKKLITTHLGNVEKEISNRLNAAVSMEAESFGDFKQKILNSNSKLTKLENDNNSKGPASDKIHADLAELDSQVKKIYTSNRVVQAFTASLQKIDFSVTYDRRAIVESIKLGETNAREKSFELIDNDDFVKSVEVDSAKCNPKNNIYTFSAAIAKSLKESINDTEISMFATERPRQGSLLKTQQSFTMPSYMNLNGSEKGSPRNVPQLKGSESLSDLRPRNFAFNNILSSSDLKPVRMKTENFDLKTSNFELNLYDKTTFNQIKGSTGELHRAQSKKKQAGNQMTQSLVCGLKNKPAAFTIKNKTLSYEEFKRLISKALRTTKDLECIDLKDNVLTFDVFKCIKDIFSTPVSKPLTIDLRRNRTEANPRRFEMTKKQLSQLNIRLIM